MIHTFADGGIETTRPLACPIPWSWKGMLRELSDVMLEKVVGDGIKGISCRPHAFTQQRFEPDDQFPRWDFVVQQVDGKLISVHPKRGENSFSIWHMSYQDDTIYYGSEVTENFPPPLC